MRNLGSTDRLIRIVVGTGMIFAGFAGQGGGACILTILGFVPLITGISGNCPLCSWLDINTCQTRP